MNKVKSKKYSSVYTRHSNYYPIATIIMYHNLRVRTSSLRDDFKEAGIDAQIIVLRKLKLQLILLDRFS